MEGKWRWFGIAAIAPIAWGANYFVTKGYLPADAPVWGSVIRALPAGLILLALSRQLPKGAWWWRSAVLGLLNVGAFFILIYVASQRLPTSIASTTMALAPIVMMLMAWALLSQRPQLLPMAGGLLGVIGVSLMLSGGDGEVDLLGLLASVGAMAMSSVGYVLAQRWRDGADVLAMTAWQLVAGGLMLVPAAVLVEGAPPALDASAVLAFVFVVVVATALANLAWMAALRAMPAGAVGMIGLLNPVTGVLLGLALGGELLSAGQFAGLALVLIGIAVGQRRTPVPPRTRIARRRTNLLRSPAPVRPAQAVRPERSGGRRSGLAGPRQPARRCPSTNPTGTLTATNTSSTR